MPYKLTSNQNEGFFRYEVDYVKLSESVYNKYYGKKKISWFRKWSKKRLIQKWIGLLQEADYEDKQLCDDKSHPIHTYILDNQNQPYLLGFEFDGQSGIMMNFCFDIKKIENMIKNNPEEWTVHKLKEEKYEKVLKIYCYMGFGGTQQIYRPSPIILLRTEVTLCQFQEKYVVVDGNHRFAAAVSQRLPYIPFYLIDTTERVSSSSLQSMRDSLLLSFDFTLLYGIQLFAMDSNYGLSGKQFNRIMENIRRELHRSKVV